MVSMPGSNPPSMKSYLIEAVLSYCRDYGFTPYLVVKVDEACKVPMEYVRQGTIVFDVSDEAVHNFSLSQDELSFQARFGEDNAIFTVEVPMARVFAVTPLEHQELSLQFEVTASPVTQKSEAQPEETRRPKRLK